ncbi:MAG: ABC transporter substrate-binding protein [Gammaproteobacteria bacterium]
MRNFITCLILLITLPAMAATGPEQLIRQTTKSVMTEIRENIDSYKSDPQKVYQLVDEQVLPHFDFAAMADLALGKYKDRVSSEQKSAIVTEFRMLLVRTYSAALVEYTELEPIYLPMDGTEADGLVTVKTQYDQQGGFPVPMDYSLRLSDDGWKVFDVSVDEISLVTNYRSSFARAIKRDGVDGLIKTLQARNQDLEDEVSREK